MKKLLLFLLPLIGTLANAQAREKPAFGARKMDRKQLPQRLPIKGKVVEAWSWKDRNGDNRLLLSETANIPLKPNSVDCEGCESKWLYACQLIGTDSVLWKLTDYVDSCEFDLLASFTPGAVRITDLDGDGVAETWVVYRLTCTSDVSPMQLKLIMHAGPRKYALRGLSRPFRSRPEYGGGGYAADDAWKTLPPAYLAYAKKLWAQYVYDRD